MSANLFYLSNFFRAAIATRGYAPTSLLFVPLSGKVCARKHDLERKRCEDNCWGERSSLVGAKRTENNRPCKRMRGENMAAKTMKTMAKLIECGLRGEEGRERKGGKNPQNHHHLMLWCGYKRVWLLSPH